MSPLTEEEEEVARILFHLPQLILDNNRCRPNVSLSRVVKRKRTLPLLDRPPPPPLTGDVGGHEQPSAAVALSSGRDDTAADPKAPPATKSTSPSLPPKPDKKPKGKRRHEESLAESNSRNRRLKIRKLWLKAKAGDEKTPPPQELHGPAYNVVPVGPIAQRPPVPGHHEASEQWLSEHTVSSTDPSLSIGRRPPADPKAATADPEYDAGCSAAGAAVERSRVLPNLNLVPGEDETELDGVQQRAGGDGKTPAQQPPPQELYGRVVPVRPTVLRPPVPGYHAAREQWLSEHTVDSTDPPFSNGQRPPADPKAATADPKDDAGCSAAGVAVERSRVLPNLNLVPGEDEKELNGVQQRAGGDGKTPAQQQPPQELYGRVVPVQPTVLRPPVPVHHAASEQWLSEHTVGSTDPPLSIGRRPPADPKAATTDPKDDAGCSAAGAAVGRSRLWLDLNLVPGEDGKELDGVQQRAGGDGKPPAQQQPPQELHGRVVPVRPIARRPPVGYYAPSEQWLSEHTVGSTDPPFSIGRRPPADPKTVTAVPEHDVGCSGIGSGNGEELGSPGVGPNVRVGVEPQQRAAEARNRRMEFRRRKKICKHPTTS